MHFPKLHRLHSYAVAFAHDLEHAIARAKEGIENAGHTVDTAWEDLSERGKHELETLEIEAKAAYVKLHQALDKLGNIRIGGGY